MPIDELAKKRWLAYPSDIRKKFEDNVFCSTCSVTTIVDYHVDSVNHKLVLRGHCKKCNSQVARVID
jgi:ribosomal protein S27AE